MPIRMSGTILTHRFFLGVNITLFRVCRMLECREAGSPVCGTRMDLSIEHTGVRSTARTANEKEATFCFPSTCRRKVKRGLDSA